MHFKIWSSLIFTFKVSFLILLFWPRIHLFAMKKKNLKQTAIILNKSLNDAKNSIYNQWHLMSLDIIDSKILKPHPPVKKKTPPKNICKVSIDNKSITAQKMKFSIKDFFSKCDQIRRKLRIWSHLLKKSLMEKLIFCAVYWESIFMIHWLEQHFQTHQLILIVLSKIQQYPEFLPF